ncbi:MAG: hypothetical protein ACOZAL_02890 [Patescibacteria group bacterium]
MAITTRTTLAANFENYVTKKVLTDFTDQLETDVVADKGDRIPQHSGDTIKFIKRLRLPRDTTELSASEQPVAKALHTMDITATAKEYGNRITIERIPDLTMLNMRFTDAAAEELANLMARQADYLITTKLAKNAFRVRADFDPTYQKQVTTTSDGGSGGTTFISTALTQADDFWNGGYATVMNVDNAYLSRESIYETRPITDFANITGTVTVSPAFNSIIKSGCVMWLCVGTALVASDALTTDVFARAVARLALNKAKQFSGKAGENLPPKKKAGAYWRVLLDAHTTYSFMIDTTFVNMGIYQLAQNLIDGTGVKWQGCNLHGRTQPWREDVDGTENESAGAVHLVHFCGEGSIGISDVISEGAKPPFGAKVNYLTAKDLGQSVERNSEMGYNLYFAICPKDSLSNVAVLCGAPTI